MCLISAWGNYLLIHIYIMCFVTSIHAYIKSGASCDVFLLIPRSSENKQSQKAVTDTFFSKQLLPFDHLMYKYATNGRQLNKPRTKPHKSNHFSPALFRSRLLWFLRKRDSVSHPTFQLQVVSQQTQNICLTFVECWTNVADAGPTLYKCYTNVSCLGLHSPNIMFILDPGEFSMSNNRASITNTILSWILFISKSNCFSAIYN